jgi:hypothetical protein
VNISTPARKSLIVILQVFPELLAILNETIDAGQELHIPENAADEMRGSPNPDHHRRQPIPPNHSQPCSVSVHPRLVQYSDSDSDSDSDSGDDVPLQSRRRSAIVLSGEIYDTEADGNEKEEEYLRMSPVIDELSS